MTLRERVVAIERRRARMRYEVLIRTHTFFALPLAKMTVHEPAGLIDCQA